MDWIATILSLIAVCSVLALRKWIEASVTRSVQHGFDEKIENLRSSLRAREGELQTLRERVLSGRANREALMDKRRLEAVEKVWATVVAYGHFETVSSMMMRVVFDEAAKSTRPPNTRKFFEWIAGFVPEDKVPVNSARTEEPFVTPLAWALFSAYSAVVISAYMRARALATTSEDISKYFTADKLRDVLKAAVPHLADFIDKNEPEMFHLLLDEIKRKLLAELKSMLEGVENDQKSIAQSAEIMKALKAATTEAEKQQAAHAAKVTQ